MWNGCVYFVCNKKLRGGRGGGANFRIYSVINKTKVGSKEK